MELKDKIYALRKKYNLTYEQVAEIVGVGKSTVRKWETGIIANIRPDKLSALAEALHTTVDYLKGTVNSRNDLSKGLGFYKVACATPVLRVANPSFNVKEIEKLIDRAVIDGVQILVTPELSLSGCTCGDLFQQETLIDACENALIELLDYTAGINMIVAVGMPFKVGFRLYNCAVIINKGEILGVVPKQYLLSSGDGCEKRMFSSGMGTEVKEISVCSREVPFGELLFKLSDELMMGVEIGTDLYSPIPPSTFYVLSGANLIINLFGMCETVSAKEYRQSLVCGQAAKGICAYALSGAGVYESTTDAVFSGDCIIAENGDVIKRGERFLREGRIVSGCIDVAKLSNLRMGDTVFCDTASICKKDLRIVDTKISDFNLKNFNRFVDAHPFIPSDKSLRRERCEEIFSIQSAALAKRLEHTGLKRCVIGISGGLDSTLALLVAVRAIRVLGFKNDSIIGITMPGFGTTDRTYTNALELMHSLGVEIREISIKDACVTHFNDIGHDASVHDITYENTQARERTQILMDIANKEGGILVGTGDLSELAMGWCTFGGDHMSMYGVNASVPKTLVRYLVEYVAEELGGKSGEILKDILDTPVSPELLPPDKSGNIAQKTEDNIGPYELHDFFLYYFFRFGFQKDKLAFLAKEAFMGQYTDEVIEKWLNVFLKRFFISQFKRSCSPDAPKVGSVSLSPRGDLRMPSDADFSEWVK